MKWRVAQCLEKLRAQVNERWPNRNKDSDGTIGNAEHSARESDHNPDTDGVVKAMDITHDPASGCDSYALAEVLRTAKDERIKYIISNHRICSGTGQDHTAWEWRKYNGKNPHDHHVHISVKPDKAHFDDVTPWNLDVAAMPERARVVPIVPATLRQGNHGEAVRDLQKLLSAKGFVLRPDADFGPATLSAIKAFQSAHSLVVDGVVGPQTWAALKA